MGENSQIPDWQKSKMIFLLFCNRSGSLTRRRKSKLRLESLACAVVAHTQQHRPLIFFQRTCSTFGNRKVVTERYVEHWNGKKKVFCTPSWKQKLLPSFSLLANVTVVTFCDYLFYKPLHFNKKKKVKNEVQFYSWSIIFHLNSTELWLMKDHYSRGSKKLRKLQQL